MTSLNPFESGQEEITPLPRFESSPVEPSVWHGTNEDVAVALVASWMDSDGHRENLLTPRFRRTGIGVAIDVGKKYGYVSETVYATQNFSSCKKP